MHVMPLYQEVMLATEDSFSGLGRAGRLAGWLARSLARSSIHDGLGARLRRQILQLARFHQWMSSEVLKVKEHMKMHVFAHSVRVLLANIV